MEHPVAADTLEEARRIATDVVWATLATVGANGTPRTRLVHPVWWWDDEHPVGLIVSRPTQLRVEHIAAHPNVSCFYWSPAHSTVAIDAVAHWVHADELLDTWRAISTVPPPVGFDPSSVWPAGPSSPDYAVLRLAAERVIVRVGATKLSTWRAPRAEP
jgi:hypothetical protein